jgi:hypothetical protein
VAPRLQLQKRHLSPKMPPKLKERGNLSVMKTLKQILFMALVVAGFSITAMAQRDNNNRPPKDPPTIPAPDKNPPKDPPKNDNNNNDRPKKPQVAVFVNRNKAETI